MSRESRERSFTEVITSGDYLASLEAIRDAIAADLAVCESMRDRAALYLRLSDVMAKIEDARPRPARGDVIDEIAARRAARRSGAAQDSARAKRAG